MCVSKPRVAEDATRVSITTTSKELWRTTWFNVPQVVRWLTTGRGARLGNVNDYEGLWTDYESTLAWYEHGNPFGAPRCFANATFGMDSACKFEVTHRLPVGSAHWILQKHPKKMGAFSRPLSSFRNNPEKKEHQPRTVAQIKLLSLLSPNPVLIAALNAVYVATAARSQIVRALVWNVNSSSKQPRHSSRVVWGASFRGC